MHTACSDALLKHELMRNLARLHEVERGARKVSPSVSNLIWNDFIKSRSLDGGLVIANKRQLVA